MRSTAVNRRKPILRRFLTAFFALFLAMTCMQTAVFAQTSAQLVRVGYYENELFQEGGEEGAVKTGYAYE